MSLGKFSKKKIIKINCILLNNFYVCGPTSMEFIPLLRALKKVVHAWTGVDDVSCIQE